MRESDIEELATHGGPEPCAVVRGGGGEASGGVRVGRAIEPRNLLVRGADAVLYADSDAHMPPGKLDQLDRLSDNGC
jgi:hypothetical protein